MRKAAKGFAAEPDSKGASGPIVISQAEAFAAELDALHGSAVLLHHIDRTVAQLRGGRGYDPRQAFCDTDSS